MPGKKCVRGDGHVRPSHEEKDGEGDREEGNVAREGGTGGRRVYYDVTTPCFPTAMQARKQCAFCSLPDVAAPPASDLKLPLCSLYSSRHWRRLLVADDIGLLQIGEVVHSDQVVWVPLSALRGHDTWMTIGSGASQWRHHFSTSFLAWSQQYICLTFPSFDTQISSWFSSVD
jgi:hypothetical protein